MLLAFHMLPVDPVCMQALKERDQKKNPPSFSAILSILLQSIMKV